MLTSATTAAWHLLKQSTKPHPAATMALLSTRPSQLIEASFARAAMAAPLIEDEDQSGGNGSTSIISLFPSACSWVWLFWPHSFISATYASSYHTALTSGEPYLILIIIIIT